MKHIQMKVTTQYATTLQMYRIISWMCKIYIIYTEPLEFRAILLLIMKAQTGLKFKRKVKQLVDSNRICFSISLDKHG